MRRPPDAESPPLGLIARQAVDESAQAAWWADLDRWVETLRESYDHLWPAPPEGVDPYARTRKRAWPACWHAHVGLVEDLVALKAWQEGLLDGNEWAGGPRGWCEWRAFVDSLAAQIQVIAQRCAFGHQEQQRVGRAHVEPQEAVEARENVGTR